MTFAKSTILICLLSSTAWCADPLSQAMSMAVSGANVQSERLKIASENIANEDSTALSPGGQPYVRKILFARNTYDRKLRAKVLKVAKVGRDTRSKFRTKHNPSHPAADPVTGNVIYPNVYKEVELFDSQEAQQAHKANLSVIKNTRSMINDIVEMARNIK